MKVEKMLEFKNNFFSKVRETKIFWKSYLRFQTDRGIIHKFTNTGHDITLSEIKT